MIGFDENVKCQPWFKIYMQDSPVFKGCPELTKLTICNPQSTKMPSCMKLRELMLPKKGPTKFCTENLGQRYYYCKDCSYDVNTSFCRDCFDLQKHKDHNISSLEEKGYCDCGMEDRWNPNGFCAEHGKQHPQPEIPQNQIDSFVEFYSGCFELYFSLIAFWNQNSKESYADDISLFHNLYGTEIFQCLAFWNRKSPYYNTLTLALMKTKIKQKYNTVYSIMQCLIELYGEYLVEPCADMLFNVSSNSEFLEYFFEVLFTKVLSKKQLGIRTYINKFFKNVYDSVAILNKLADRNIAIFSEFNEQEDETIDFYMKVLKATTSAKNRKPGILTPVWKCLRRKNILEIDKIPEIYIGKMLNEIHNDENLFQNVLPQMFDFLASRIKKKQAAEEKSQIAKHNVFSFFNEIMKLIFKSIEGKVEKILSYFLSLGMSFDVLAPIFLEYMREIIEDPNRMNIFSIHAIINLNNFFNIKQKGALNIIEQLWKSELTGKKVFTFMDCFVKNIISKNLKTAYMEYQFMRNEEDKEMFIKIREQLFKEYLYMKKKIKRSTLIYMKRAGILDFPRAGEILSEMTYYVKVNLEFIYRSKEIHDNPDLLLLNAEENPHDYLTFKPYEKDHIFTTRTRYYLFEQLFSPDFIDAIKGEKINYEKMVSLVMIDKVMMGENKYLRQYLLSIYNVCLQNPEDNESRINKLFRIEKNKVKVMEIDPKINDKVELKKPQIEKENKKDVEVKQTPLKAKRAKLNQKFAQKQIKHLEKLKIEEKKIDHDVVCIICKDTEHPGNQLGYLAKINKSDIFNSLCKQKSSYNIILNTCFHTIHRNCFQAYRPNASNRTCPLCKQSINCFLPLQHRRDQDYWQHRLLTAFQIKYTEKDPVKMLALFQILKTLVFKNGIFNIFTPFTAKEERINYYLINLLVSTFRSFNLEEKIEFESYITKLLIESGSNQVASVKSMEIMLIETLNLKMRDKIIEPDYEKFNSLKKLLSVNEFERFMHRYMGFIGQKQPGQHFNSPNCKQLSIISAPPSSVSQAFKLRKFCAKCPHIECWYCILCKEVFCAKCEGVNAHRRNRHNGITIILMIGEGEVKLCQNYQEHKLKVYKNAFKQEWENIGNSQHYILDQEAYLEAIGKWMRNN